MAGNSAAKRWVFTLNNPTLDEHPGLWLSGHTDVEAWAGQYELGSQGTYHFQGLVTLRSRKRLTQMRQMNGRAHWEKMRGTLKQAVDYCSKEDTRESVFFSEGLPATLEPEKPVQKLQREIEEGGTLMEVYSANFSLSCRYHAFIQKYVGMQIKPRTWQTTAVVITGPTGTGKSGQIMANHSTDELYWKPHGPWWDGYVGQEYVVFDEFYSWYPYGDLLRLLDRYPLKVPFKGGFVEFAAKCVYFTSNSHWREWYGNIPVKDALYRRLTVCLDMTEVPRQQCWNGPVSQFHILSVIEPIVTSRNFSKYS
ncbi:replication-associated protein [robinz virus RP_327]|nr:replication-associated protein [robinz virus RP_327]